MKNFFSLTAIFILALVYGNSASAYEDWKGKQRALVLLLEWDNEPARVTVKEMDETFFALGKPSLRQFFNENSGGKFDITGDVRGWKRADRSWSRLWSWDGCDVKTIVEEAWATFGKDINIADYDYDHDGKIDNLYIVHSGRIRLNRVGPDCVFSWGGTSYANQIAVFQSQGLGEVGNYIPIGFYLHEAGHGFFYLGDYYGDGHYDEGKYGVGMWGMMGLGAWGTSNRMPVEELFRYPSHFEAASKVRIGWANMKLLVKNEEHVVLRPVETSADVAIVPIDAETNYYIEYRSNRGFSMGHPGHGLLIWKNWQLIQADGRDDLNHGNKLGRRPLPPHNENFGDASDPFPGSTGKTFFVDQDLGLIIDHITVTDDQASFDVRYLGTDRVDASFFRTVDPRKKPRKVKAPACLL